jgi:sugar lactone lactonase YvrE
VAPELSDQLHWVNTTPLRIKAQRGRVVALAFFSAGSSYCANLLDELRSLQSKYADGLIVIGVHTPKFEGERSPALALKTVNRLGVRFPVVHDQDFVSWQHFGVRAWPTVVLIDVKGNIAGTVVGDMRRQELDKKIAQILESADPAERQFEPALPVSRAEAPSDLSFPMGVALSSSALYIADSGNHRILECSHEGRVLRQFGSGNQTYLDGAGAESAFSQPRGLLMAGDLLYVLDTGNHALRRIKMLTGEVETLAGNGRSATALNPALTDPTQQSLNRPCDIVGTSEKLYLSMAGCNQIWSYDLIQRKLSVLAGSGRLAVSDGSCESASFAQPTGLALVQQTMYISDAAGSAIRSINLNSGQVQTLVGQGPFSFGDTDGSRSTAMLQYPVGLALDPASPLLWVVDSYNNCLKSLRLGGGEVKRIDIDHKLCEPTAICAGQGSLWLANTNAHEILRIDPGNGSTRRIAIGG